MSVKKAYKIPTDLNTSVADMEISLKNSEGVGPRPLPLKVIFFILCSIMLCFYAVMKTFISKGPLWAILCFILLWALLTVLLVRYDATKQMQIQMLPSLLRYIPKSSRRVITRSNCRADEFYGIANILDVNGDTGLVSFSDGTFGYCYRVVGSASILLFDADKAAILRRVDAFYRKFGTDAEIVMLTVKESQKVYRQLMNLKRRFDRLEQHDPDLDALAVEQFNIMKTHVGGTFKSIHQYMILKADNKEALIVAKNVLQSEVENSTLMIKQCVPLFGDDIYALFRMIYR